MTTNPEFEKNNALVVFDIRNFTAHRFRLGKANIGGGRVTTTLVTDILNDAVNILNKCDEEFHSTESHFLNHTGDGFVLVVRGKLSPLIALLFISEFRKQADFRIRHYQAKIKKNGKFAAIAEKLPRLDFGIGAHVGWVKSFSFDNFGTPGLGVIGTSINIASRVEQCTKDHDCNVIFTDALKNKVLKIIPKPRHNDFAKFYNSLGKHKLRGIEDEPYTLNDFEPKTDKPEFYKAWKSWKENGFTSR